MTNMDGELTMLDLTIRDRVDMEDRAIDCELEAMRFTELADDSAFSDIMRRIYRRAAWNLTCKRRNLLLNISDMIAYEEILLAEGERPTVNYLDRIAIAGGSPACEGGV
nr:hypothetical protein [Rhodococcus sp. (in: high G+C Gram-positive bacteria)]